MELTNSMIVCPECGKKHRNIETAHSCLSKVENEWGHFIILCYNLPGGVTKENVASYNIDVVYFEEVEKRIADIRQYYQQLQK